MYVTYTRIYGWSDYGGESSYQPGYRLENMMWMTLLVYDYIIPGDNNKKIGYTIRMDEATLRRLELYCKKMGMLKSQAIREAINALPLEENNK